MKLIHYLYIVPLALLASCSGEQNSTSVQEQPTPGEECHYPIQLSAGIVEGGQDVTTRATSEANHANHLKFEEGTKLALRLSGTWTGNTVTKTTTATVGAETTTGSKHNVLSAFDPVHYWDEFGTADADNTAGRAEGLTIYGVAIDSKTTAPTVADYTALSWTLPANQTENGNTPADKDLLISNNVQASTDDGTYKFDEYINAPTTYSKLLEFTHALSKITVNLKAGDGFSGSAFAGTPTVTLTSNEGTSTTNTEWPCTTGIINVTTGGVSSQSGNNKVTMFNCENATEGWTKTYEALVMPGSAFAANASDIVKINADGNIYYVTAEKIRTAAVGKAHTAETGGEILTKAGYNYIINVTVNKTDIVVTATVTNWTDVTAAEVSPVINVSADFGTTGSTMSDGSFSFYRSTSLDNGYSNDASLIENSFYKEESVVTKSGSTWTMAPTLYWPNHNTHYQFRGVWPRTVTTSGEGILASPRVEAGSGDTNGCQVIKVQNVAYALGSFPSDLQIARPEIDASAQCTNSEPGHTKTYLYDGGICATEGTVNLNFKYMMSQVEVNLSTTNNTLGDAVTLSGAVVEIINVYSTGDVKLGDRGVVPTGSTGSYTLDAVASNENKRLSAIVPQALTSVKFRITIDNGGGNTDVYYADVAPIKKNASEDLVAPNGAWESGYHYVYNLMLSKTKVNVTATLANWTTVDADENVWF